MTKKNLIRGAFATALLTVMVQTTLSFSTKEINSNQTSSIAHSYHSGYPTKNISSSTTTMDVTSQNAGGFALFDKWHAKHDHSVDRDYPFSLIGDSYPRSNTFEFSYDSLRPWSSHSWGSAGSYSGRNSSQTESNQHSSFSSKPTLANGGGTPSDDHSSNTPQSDKEPSKDNASPADTPVPTGGPSTYIPQSENPTKGTKPNETGNTPEDKSSGPDTFTPVITDPSENPSSAPEEIIEEDIKDPGDIENSSGPQDSSCVVRPESCSAPDTSQPSDPRSDVKDDNGDIVPASPENPSTPVPEPESLALLLAGALGFKLIRRTKK